jgi:CHAT domain-containing protein
VLVPEAERKLLVADKLKRLIVIPDAALAAFPFETLVVEAGEMPKYLLDVGPPIVTAPSATLLMNLSELKTGEGATQPNKPGEKALLSVADPNYNQPSAGPVTALAEVSARSRYGALKGDLTPLPFTAWECSWVVETFRKAGLDAGALQKASARESSVRKYAPGRKYLHFACHGLVDQSHGNLFGALALTPGPRGSADPADDGFLTLAEIYELNLRGTELSILSACDTNYGPNQKGEGSWSLSRGFLVAGSKRVIASNWLVDDEAGASLVSVFCSELVKEKPDESLDYAAKLQAAKRWVRNQEKWRSPYYWGTFVLVGPN